MSLGKRLKFRREQLGMTQTQLASILGITKGAVGNYENGVSSPKEEVLLKIFDALDVEPNYLFQDSYSQSDFTCSLQEQTHIKKYRNLDDYGKKQVDTTLNNEYERCTSSSYFSSYDKAMEYITANPIFAMGGLDIESMEEDELIEFANDQYEMEKKYLK